MSGDFSGKVVVITGASSGLGHTLAVKMAEKGAVIGLCGRDRSKLEAVAGECRKISPLSTDCCLVFSGDITNRENRREILQKTVDKFGGLDVLVNNAGISLPQCTAEETNEEGYDYIMDVNLKSAFFLSQAAIPHLSKRKGCIVNMSSILSTIVGPKFVVYSISKAAMDSMTKNMALGLAHLGIRVNAVNPSFIPGTGITREFTNPKGDPQVLYKKHEETRQPMNNNCGTAEDVANAVCFLASQEASFVTGQCLLVDGGRYFLGAS